MSLDSLRTAMGEHQDEDALIRLATPKARAKASRRTFTPSIYARPLPGVVGRRDDLDLDEES
jgi:hypothetical protein